MCFTADARPPDLPDDLRLAPIAGGAAAGVLELESADGTRFSAALAEAPDGGATGVVILPDVRGLHQFYIELAERFAEAGYPAIAIDFYARTAGLGPRGDDFEYGPHRQQVKLEQAWQDIAAAIAELRERTDVESLVTVGFCFGGSMSFVSGANPELGLAAVVGFYGVLDPARFDGQGVLAKAGEIRTPLLGLFGGADQAIPGDQVEEFGAALTDSGAEHEIHVYPGAPHSFFDKKQDEFAKESEDAWRRILGFLAEIREQATA
jgi:carboxymethylenebutenolidase